MVFADKIDISCIITAVLFFLANLLNIILRSMAFSHMSEESFESRLALDPVYLQSQWLIRSQHIGLKTAAGMVNAMAWFAFCIPILQVSWILSKGGKRHLGTHIFLAGLVIAGSTIEAVSRLMIIGIDSVSHWMANDFNLNSWNYRNDGIGWRVLEMVYEACNGIIVWIDAFEWLALSGILIIVYASADSERKEDEMNTRTFSLKWAHYGVVIGTLCWFDFLASVMRLENWRLFMTIAIFISTLNMLVFLPVWLIWLGRQLSNAKPVYYDIAHVIDRHTDGMNGGVEPYEDHPSSRNNNIEMQEMSSPQKEPSPACLAIGNDSSPSPNTDTEKESEESTSVFEIS